MTYPRELPHSPEAERAFLAAILLAPVSSLECPVHERVFFLERHRLLYRAMVAVEQEYGADRIDMRTVQAQLEAWGKWEEAGGLSVLASLDIDLPDLSRTGTYVDILEKRYASRELVRMGHRMMTEAMVSDPSELRDRTITALGSLGSTAPGRGFAPLADFADELLDPDPHGGIGSGIPDLDRIMNGGGRPGQLIFVVGRPGMGKSAFALNMAGYNALRAGRPVGIRSMEMSRREYLARLGAWDLQLDSRRLRSGHLTRDERAELERWVARASNAPLFISDAAGGRFSRIAGELRSLRARHKIEAAYVDQLSFVRPDSSSSGEKGHEVKNRIAHDFKSLAVELEIPIYLLHQLTRGPEHREDRAPRASDLRDAGEEPADIILAPWRPNHHLPDADQSVAQVLVLKHRDGATGPIPAVWIPETTTYRGVSSR